MKFDFRKLLIIGSCFLAIGGIALSGYGVWEFNGEAHKECEHCANIEYDFKFQEVTAKVSSFTASKSRACAHTSTYTYSNVNLTDLFTIIGNNGELTEYEDIANEFDITISNTSYLSNSSGVFSSLLTSADASGSVSSQNVTISVTSKEDSSITASVTGISKASTGDWSSVANGTYKYSCYVWTKNGCTDGTYIYKFDCIVKNGCSRTVEKTTPKTCHRVLLVCPECGGTKTLGHLEPMCPGSWIGESYDCSITETIVEHFDCWTENGCSETRYYYKDCNVWTVNGCTGTYHKCSVCGTSI